MSFLRYIQNGDIIEIIVRDATSKKIESYKFNVNDKKLGNRIFKHLLDKFGFSPELKPEEHVPPKDNWLEGDKLIE